MNLSGLDLNLLVTLDALLAERSVTRAGRRVGLSQPAMSHALGRLRAQLDDPVLERGPGGLVPTARARRLIPDLAAALAAARRVFETPVAFDPASWTGEFRLAMNDYNELALLPRVLRRVRREAPGVDLRIRAIGTAARDLDDDTIDLAMATFSQPPPHLRVRAVLRERFVCLLRKGHPAAAHLDLDTYCALDHLLIAPRGDTRGPVNELLEAQGRRRRIALTTPHFLVAPLMVAESDLIVTLPERIARRFAAKWGLIVLEPPLALATFPVSMAWHPRTDADPALTWFRELWAEEGAAVGKGGSSRGGTPQA